MSTHTSTIAKYVRYYIDVQSNELGNLPLVRSAAGIMREIIYNNRNALSASMICSGWDPYVGYQIYSVNQHGFHAEGDYAVSGSGNIFIMGYFDAYYQQGTSRTVVVEVEVELVVMVQVMLVVLLVLLVIEVVLVVVCQDTDASQQDSLAAATQRHTAAADAKAACGEVMDRMRGAEDS